MGFPFNPLDKWPDPRVAQAIGVQQLVGPTPRRISVAST